MQSYYQPVAKKELTLDDLIQQMLTNQSKYDSILNSQTVAIRNFEVQMGQIANALNTRPPGTLPSNTEENPEREGKEQVNAITMRSGNEIPSRDPPIVKKEIEKEKVGDNEQ